MLETFGFFSHMQTCETSGYQTSYYVYLILYSSKFCIFGHTDILILKELTLLGAPQQPIDFAGIAKLDKLEPPNTWNLRAFAGLIS
jgi:hypothetical protein